MFEPSAALSADFYKVGHRPQYPAGTELVYSNLTARSSKLAKSLHDSGSFDNKVVFFGLQGYIQNHLIDNWNRTFFHLPKSVAIGKYERIIRRTLGDASVSVDHLEALHDLGYLPLIIKALPEGSRVNIRVPVLTIANTLPEFFWLTNFIETSLSAENWKPMTTATTAFEYKRLLTKWATLTGSPIEGVQWQAHDFSMRGLSGVHDAMVSSPGHLLSFSGTDVIPAIEYLEEFYGADVDKELVGGSVPATEHSVMCMGGLETEIQTFRRLITDLYPNGILSIVSDTWDFWKVMTQYSAELKAEILARDGKVVFRPDSGDPVKILTGYIYKSYPSIAEAKADYGFLAGYSTANEEVVYEAVEIDGKFYKISFNRWPDYSVSDVEIGEQITPAEAKGAVECLWEVFSGTTTSTGHRLLDSHVGLIYGDSITIQRAEQIMSRLANKDFASANVVLGVGSFTYQHVTRDTLGFAVKSTYGVINGVGTEIFKDPITDNGIKKSAKGLLRVEKEGNDFVLYDQQTPQQEALGELRVVFRNGEVFHRQTLAQIRATLTASLNPSIKQSQLINVSQQQETV